MNVSTYAVFIPLSCLLLIKYVRMCICNVWSDFFRERRIPKPSPTTIYCDNVPAQGIANRTVTLRRSKAIHTRYNWIRNRVDHGQYTIARMPGKTIDADYLTKIHPRPKQEQFMVRLTHQPFLPKH